MRRPLLKPGLLANAVASAFESFVLPLADLGSGQVDTKLQVGSGSATFTRATTATTVDSTGLVVSVGSGVPRSYYDPTTLEYMGYLAEGSRTNLALRSEEFDNASWIKDDTTPTANAVASPDGGSTADLLTEGTAGTGLVMQTYTATANTTQTFSLWLKRGNHDWVGLLIWDSANAANRVFGWVNLATGTVGSAQNNGTGTGAVISIKAYQNGWYRATLSGAPNNSVTSLQCGTFSATADAVTTRVSGATRYQWGAQVENNVSFASSYIPTTTASVTRNADVLTYALAGNLDVSSGSAYCEARLHEALSGSRAMIAGGGGAGLVLYANITNDQFQTFDGTTVLSSSTQGLLTGVRRGATSWGSGQSVCGSGGAVSTGAFDGDKGITTSISIGIHAASSSLFGTIKNVRLWTSQLSNAQLQGLTA